MLHFRTLGAAEIAHDDGRPIDIAGRQSKRVALLAFLALARPRGGHRRDSLMAMLWPEVDQTNARAALRQALHGIRKSLGADVVRSDGTEIIELDRTVLVCDAWDFEAHAQLDENERALALYHGELLNGLFVQDAPAFEHWLDGERSRARAIAQKCAWRVANAASERDTPRDCVRSVHRAMSFAPLDESAVREGMGLLARVGERAAAFTLYKEFETTLARELEVAPSPETRAVFASLSAEDKAIAVPRTADAVSNGSAPVFADQSSTASTIVRHQSIAPRIAPAQSSASQEHTHWRAAAVILASVITLGAAAQLSPSRHTNIDPRRVLVESFVNESGLAVLDTIASAVAWAVRDSIGTIEGVALDAADDVSASVQSSGNEDKQTTRAGTIVRGSLRATRDSVELRVQVVDVESHQIVRSERRMYAMDRRALVTNVATTADVVSAAVASSVYPGWGRAVGQPPSLAAYSAFVTGLRYIQHEQHALAASSLRRAYNLDSSFAIGGLVAAIEYYQLKKFHVADTIAKAIAQSSRKLTPVDLQLLQWVTSSLRGDRITARAAMSEVTRLAPSAELAWLQLAIDNVETDRPGEALVALAHVEHSNMVATGWLSFWTTKLEALHLARDHRAELRTAREALARHPEFRVIAGYELRALAALGQSGEITRRLASGPDMLATDGNDGASTFRQVALELAAHGHSLESRQLLGTLLEWYDNRPDSVRCTTVHRSGKARTYFLLGENSRALAMYDSVLSRKPGCVDCIGVRGVLAARMGNTGAAAGASEQLAQITEPFLFARHLLWRARIAGALGDAALASHLLTSAFADGSEFDIMTHADPDLAGVAVDKLYREYSFVSNAH